jgi:hypothetical protein
MPPESGGVGGGEKISLLPSGVLKGIEVVGGTRSVSSCTFVLVTQVK